MTPLDAQTVQSVVQYGSFGLIAYLVITVLRYAPRAVKAFEGMRDTLERIEEKIDRMKV